MGTENKNFSGSDAVNPNENRYAVLWLQPPVKAQYAKEEIDGILGFMKEISGPGAWEHAKAIDRARDGDTLALYRIGTNWFNSLDRDSERAGLSMIWVSACMGDVKSMQVLLKRLWSETRAASPLRQPQYIERICFKWMNLIFLESDTLTQQGAPSASGSGASGFSVLSSLAARGGLPTDSASPTKRIDTVIADLNKKIKEREASQSSSGGVFLNSKPITGQYDATEEEHQHGKIVLRAIGDPESKEGRDLQKRYGDYVNKVLPMAGTAPENLSDFEADLINDFPWMGPYVARLITGHIAMRRIASGGRGGFRLPNILLVGNPGCGKTEIIHRICNALNFPRVTVPCGGTSDAAALGAVSRGWATSRVCAPFSAMVENEICNPVIILDELDKGVSISSPNGSILGVAVSMLESGENGFWDTCLMSKIDLSAVSFFATANSLEGLHDSLLDRFNVINIESPSADHFQHVLSAIMNKYAESLNMNIEDMPRLRDGDELIIREQFERSNFSIREVKRQYERIVNDIALENSREPDNV